MARRELREDGVVLEFDDHVFNVMPAAKAPAPAPARRRGQASFDDEGPRPLGATPGPATGTPPPGGAAEQLAQRLVARGTVRRAGAPIYLGTGSAAPTRRGAAPAAPARLTVPLAPGETAVVLLEGDGVLAWRFGHEAPASAFAQVKRSLPAATRALVFEIDVPTITAVPERARRGWIRDKLVEGAKAIVLYFAAEAVAAGAVRLLERKRRTGPVIIGSARDVQGWRPVDDLRALVLPSDRPRRLLMLVHGTFSSTVGGFGELTATPWGQRLLEGALARYDAVIGFDHRTMSQTPLDNARDLLAALRTLPPGPPVEIDAISHSRGGLLLRSLTEYLLPDAGLTLNVKRAIFVAATNHGTELARPGNWETLVDLTTNLAAITAQVLSLFPAAAAAAQIADEVIDCIGEFVKYLVEVAVTERQVPGIAAMDPGGDFVRDINDLKPGRHRDAGIENYAIVSDFYAKLFESGEHEPKELPKRLAVILADGVIDRLMRGSGDVQVANDLVVDVASMTDIDHALGGNVKDVFDFGSNPLVYHTNYFLRPETVGHLAQWLRLPSPLEGVDALSVAGAQRGIAPVRADATVAQVREVLARETPNYLVIARPDPARRGALLHYAVTPAEFTAGTRGAAPQARVIDAFGLHEVDQSAPFDAQQLPFDGTAVASNGNRPHAKRGVVLSGSEPMAVLDAGFVAADMVTLAAIAHALQAPTPGPAPGADPPLPGSVSIADAFGAVRRYRSDPSERNYGFEGPVPDALRRAPVTRAPRPLPAPAPPSPKRAPVAPPAAVQVYAGAEMPRQVRLGALALVSVTLSAEQIEAAAGTANDQGDFKAKAGDTLTVHVIPRRGYDYAPGDATDGLAQVPTPRAGAPETRDFMLVANEVGPGEVTVAVRLGTVRMLTLTLRAEVIEANAAPRLGSVASAARVEPGAECGLCPTLEIFDRRNAGQLQYEYILRAGDVSDRFRSEPIQADPRAYVEARYTEIEKAWLGSDRAVDRFALRLETMGGQMFRALFPPKLQETLWRLAQDGDLDDVLVHSDEPFLPWEVVFLDDPAAPASSGKGRFFGELGLCRWLFGTRPVCKIEVRPGKARYVVPHYPDPRDRLADAEAIEEPMLKAQLGATAIPPNHAEVVALLRQPGSFDLLHFACHGEADPEQIDSAALLLQGELIQQDGQTQWVPERLRASTVAQFADLRGPDGNRPLVVVNACQAGRLGYSLTGLGGYATAFLGTREGTGDSRGRAGAFVGALWSVGDQPASDFVTVLYRELQAGKTIAQATRAARTAARDAGDGSWLAYTVYAHPHLKLNFR